MNLCSKPRCARPGSVALAYDYAGRRAVLHDPPEGEMSPHLYALCGPCAERLRPPRGWTMEDARSEPPLFADMERSLALSPPSRQPIAEPASTRRIFFSAPN